MNEYEKKERYVGLFGEWTDEATSAGRRAEIEPELRELYEELDSYLKPAELYNKLIKEIV